MSKAIIPSSNVLSWVPTIHSIWCAFLFSTAAGKVIAGGNAWTQ